MIYLVLITAITVSLDSFVCGLSLSIGNNKKVYLVSIITLTVYLMCLVANYSTLLLRHYLTKKASCFGGLLLILVGIYNLFKKEDNLTTKSNKSFLAQCFIVGFAVGIDGAIGNFSLALMGINAFYVPLIIALTHGVMILLSVLLCKTNLFSKISKYQFVPALLLILLGLYKTIGFFI